MRIGSVIAAACTGEIASARIGTASAPSPDSPDFDSPISMTAGAAAA